MSDANLRHADLRDANLIGAELSDADLRLASNLDKALNADQAFWFKTTCPDGSMNVGTQPCSEIF